MKIIHLSDFNCPYSYIGLNRLKNVCSELEYDIEWEMRSFELEPNVRNLSTVDKYIIKNGLTKEEALKEIEEIEEIAGNDGLEINYKTLRFNSSNNAHRLVKYVQNNYPEKSEELVFKIFESNFIDNRNIAKREVLAEIASSCGLNENEILEFLKSESLKIEVYLDTDEAITNRINTTPYYFVEKDGERLTIPGVFEKDDFKIALKDLADGKIREKSYV